MKNQPVYRALSLLLLARQNCLRASDNHTTPWIERHAQEIETLAREFLPHGSGFDSGTALVLDGSAPEKLTLTTSYHHMDNNGSYCGWSHHIVTIVPSLAFDFEIDISGDASYVLDREAMAEAQRKEIEQEGCECCDYDVFDEDFFLDYVAQEFAHCLRKIVTQTKTGWTLCR